MAILSFLVIAISVAIQFILIYLAFKFVAAQEKMAEAFTRQSDVFNALLKVEKNRNKIMKAQLPNAEIPKDEK